VRPIRSKIDSTFTFKNCTVGGSTRIFDSTENFSPNQNSFLSFGALTNRASSSSFFYPYPTERGRYNMFFLMLKIRKIFLRPVAANAADCKCLCTGLLYGLHIRRTGHNPPRGSNAGWWMLTIANATKTNSLTYPSKYGGARDNKCRSPIRFLTFTKVA
jgi:hypothetical protein